MEFSEASSTLTRANQVYQQVRWKLLAGGFLPGERLTVRQVAQGLNVSFTPAREGLLRLSTEGALILGPRFFSVPLLSSSSTDEIYRARRLLEVDLALAALPRLTPESIGHLQSIQDAMVEALSTRRYSEALVRNYLFHFGLYSAAQMPIILHVVEELWVRCGPSLNYMYPKLVVEPGHVHGHIPILNALRERDPQMLQQALERDLGNGQRSIKSSLENGS